MDFYELSDAAILKELGARIKRRRLNRNLTQQQVADKGGTSRRTISLLESGHQVGLKHFLCALRGLDALHELDGFFPKMPISPLQLAKLQGKERQRAHPGKVPNDNG